MLNKAINALIEYHMVLRCSISTSNPMQTIKSTKQFELAFFDYAHMEEDDKKDVFTAVMEAQKEPFDLNSPPHIRAILIRMEDEKHVLALAFPHIIMDGGGSYIFVQHLDESIEGTAADGIIINIRF